MSRGRGLGSGSKVNLRELTIILVTYIMPKTLTGMNQNGEQAGPWILFFQGKDISACRGKAGT